MNSLLKRFNVKRFFVFLFLSVLLCGSFVIGYQLSLRQSGYAQDEEAIHKKSFYPVRIQTNEGSYLLRVELADTPEKSALGLMGRTELKPDHGMLFLFPKEQHVSFWMRNTLIPLDLIYIAKDGVINHIHPMAQPLDETQLPSKGGKVIAVIEIAGGQAEAHNIRIGDKVETPLLEGNKIEGKTE